MSETMDIEMPHSSALVVVLGNACKDEVMQVKRIFLQGHPQRENMGSFLSLTSQTEQNGQVVLVPIETEFPRAKKSNPNYQEFFHDMLRSVPSIREVIENALHNLRSHQILLKAGLGDQNIMPLDVILLADLADPTSAALVPLMLLIQSLLVHQPGSQSHLLLKTAVFSPTNEEQKAKAMVYANLQHLETLLASDSDSLLNQVSEHLGIDPPPLSSYNIYLFDRYKEGIWEVKDESELHELMGNFLLALLLDGLARKLSEAMPWSDIAAGRAFYRGAGTTLLHFDPHWIVEACARQNAVAILDLEFSTERLPPVDATQETAFQITEKIGTLRAWMDAFCKTTLFKTSSGNELDPILHISDLDFEGLPMNEWSYAISAYDKYFKEKIFPKQREILNANAQELRIEKYQILTRLLDELTEQVNLYPAGVTACEQIVSYLSSQIQEQGIDLFQKLFLEEELDKELQSVLKQLDDAVGALPQPPKWIRHLPNPIRKWGISLFHLAFIRRELSSLVELREQAVQKLEQKYGLLIKSDALKSLRDISDGMMEIVAGYANLYRQLKEKTKAARKKLEGKANHLPFNQTIFRISLADTTLLDWAYRQWKKSEEEQRRELLISDRLLKDWQKITVSELVERLMVFGKETYRPISQMSLAEILQRCDPLTLQRSLDLLAQGAVPALRPDFDRIGGGFSSQSQILLCEDPHRSESASLLNDRSNSWQLLATGDPFIAIWCRVRSFLPLESLTMLMRETKQAYESLTRRVRQELELSIAEQKK